MLDGKSGPTSTRSSTPCAGLSADAHQANAQVDFSPALSARATPAERRAMFERIRGDFGAVTVDGHPRRRRRRLDCRARRDCMAGTFELTLEPAPPSGVTRLAVEVGDEGPADRETAAIALKPDMDAADMARTLDAWLQPLAGRDAFAGVVLIARDGTPLLQRATVSPIARAGLAAAAETGSTSAQSTRSSPSSRSASSSRRGSWR